MTYEAKKLMEQISGVKFCWTKYMEQNVRGKSSKPSEAKWRRLMKVMQRKHERFKI